MRQQRHIAVSIDDKHGKSRPCGGWVNAHIAAARR